MLVSLLVLASIIGALIGFVGLFKPLPSFSIKSRGIAGGVLGVSVVAFFALAATLPKPAQTGSSSGAQAAPAESAPAQSAPAAELDCEFVKTYELYGQLHTVAYVGLSTDPTHLIACAEQTLQPDPGKSFNYVYLFNDKAKAQAWAPTAFFAGPDHDGCIGRAYQENRDGSFIYTPQNEW